MHRPRWSASVAYMKAQNVSRVLASCHRQVCRHMATLPLDPFPDSATLDDIKERLVCTACGNRENGVMPDWSSQPPPDPNAPTTFDFIRQLHAWGR